MATIFFSSSLQGVSDAENVRSAFSRRGLTEGAASEAPAAAVEDWRPSARSEPTGLNCPTIAIVNDEEGVQAALARGAYDAVIHDRPHFGDRLAAAAARAAERTALAHTAAAAEVSRHRSANRLTMIVSLLRLQSSGATDTQARQALAEAQARVAAVAQVPAAAETEDVVEIGAYFQALADEAAKACHMQIRLTVESPGVSVASDKAAPLGVLFVELLLAASVGAPAGDIEAWLGADGGGEGRLTVVSELKAADQDAPANRLLKAMAHAAGAVISAKRKSAGHSAEVVFPLA